MTAQVKPAIGPQPAPASDHIDIAAERAILHALLNGRDIRPVLLEALRPDMFSTIAHGWLFAAILELHEKDSEIGVLTLMNRARERGELDVLFDGPRRGEDLIRWLRSDEAAPDGSETLRGNAQIVKEQATRRLMKKRAIELANMADNETIPAATQITQFENRLNEIKPLTLDDSFIKAGGALSAHYDILSAKSQYKAWGLTPFETFAQRGMLLRDDTFICVIGPEGSGKSSLLAGWAEYSAQHGVKTAYIHTEMTTQDVLDRAAVRRDKRIAFSELMKPDEISQATWTILTDELAGDDPYGGNLFIWHAGAGRSESSLLTAMTRLADDYGIREFHIDYLNDFVPDQQKDENKTGAWRNMLARVEHWGESHHARVIFAAQMNKDGGAYEIGRAARQKAHIYMELVVEYAEFTLNYAYDDVTYRVFPEQVHPIHTVQVHKVRHGAGAGAHKLLFIGPRYLWVDVPTDMIAHMAAQAPIERWQRNRPPDLPVLLRPPGSRPLDFTPGSTPGAFTLTSDDTLSSKPRTAPLHLPGMENDQ